MGVRFGVVYAQLMLAMADCDYEDLIFHRNRRDGYKLHEIDPDEHGLMLRLAAASVRAGKVLSEEEVTLVDACLNTVTGSWAEEVASKEK